MKKDWGLKAAILFLTIGLLLIFFPFDLLDGKRLGTFILETKEYDKLGQFISGITAPFLSISAFILLYLTYKSQKQELLANRILLKKQQTTIEKQQFETTFFNMLNLHHNIVTNIDVLKRRKGPSSSPREEVNGRDCFVTFYEGINTWYKIEKKKNIHMNEADVVKIAFASFFKKHQSDLGHYFRNLYQITKFIHKSNIQIKDEYIALLRAQLSSHELLVLFYSSLSLSGMKFKPLIETYHFFKSIPLDELIKEEHKNLYKESAFVKGNYSLQTEIIE